MKLSLWRICNRDYAASAFNGEGTFRRGGRWNSPGRYIVYASDSLALASREYLSGIPLVDLIIPQLVYFEVKIDSRFVEELDPFRLPAKWSSTRHRHGTRRIGDGWYDERRSLILRVPSAVIPVGFNFLINRKHPAFHHLVVSRAQAFSYDERTVSLLAKAVMGERLSSRTAGEPKS